MAVKMSRKRSGLVIYSYLKDYAVTKSTKGKTDDSTTWKGHNHVATVERDWQHEESSISKLCYLNLHLYNVSMFHVTESRSNRIQYGKEQTVSELYMDKIVLRAKRKYPDKKYELRYWNCVFSAHFFRQGIV